MNPLYRNDRAGQFPKSWYAATADIPAERPPLYGETRADVCIVGAGFTGLTAALRLAQKGISVVVLDAHRAGFGASGRNGGQVGTGFNQSQRWLSKHSNEHAAHCLWYLAEEAKADLRDLVAKHAPGARYTPGVVHGAYSVVEAAKDHAEADFLNQHYGYDQIQKLDRAAIGDIVQTESYHGGIIDMGAGHIHPLRYAIGLAQACIDAGVHIFERSEVHKITHAEPAIVHTGQGRVVAGYVILAGNGYLPNIERKIAARVMPINSFIGATPPLGDQAAKVLARDIAVADSKFVVNYYRMSEDNRLLFGGRESYGIGFPKDIETALHARMVGLFPQLKGVGFDYVWGGTLGITTTRLPAVQRIAPNILSASGFSATALPLRVWLANLWPRRCRENRDVSISWRGCPHPAFPAGPHSVRRC